MKRKHFDPKGERHPELRGKDEYVRISWDEALDLVAGEIKRIRETYGPAAIAAMASSIITGAYCIIRWARIAAFTISWATLNY